MNIAQGKNYNYTIVSLRLYDIVLFVYLSFSWSAQQQAAEWYYSTCK